MLCTLDVFIPFQPMSATSFTLSSRFREIFIMMHSLQKNPPPKCNHVRVNTLRIPTDNYFEIYSFYRCEYRKKCINGYCLNKNMLVGVLGNK